MSIDFNLADSEMIVKQEDLPTDIVTISRAELEFLRTRADAANRDEDKLRVHDKQELHHGTTPKIKFDDDVPKESFHPRVSDIENRYQKELASRDERLLAMESTCKEAIRDCELATLLAGRPLVNGAASQLIKLWREEFDVYEEEGTYKVAGRDGRKPAQLVNEWLASSDYAHFCLPSSRGGTGARDANRPSAIHPQTDGPKNLGEAIVMKWREESALRSSNSMKTIGLKRHR